MIPYLMLPINCTIDGLEVPGLVLMLHSVFLDNSLLTESCTNDSWKTGLDEAVVLALHQNSRV
jgi:hypothetical protein